MEARRGGCLWWPRLVALVKNSEVKAWGSASRTSGVSEAYDKVKMLNGRGPVDLAKANERRYSHMVGGAVVRGRGAERESQE